MPLEYIWSMELREAAQSYRSSSLEFRCSTTMPYDWLKLRWEMTENRLASIQGKVIRKGSHMA